MKSNRFLNEALKVDTLEPQNVDTATVTSDYVEMKFFRKALFVVTAAGGTAENVTATVYKATDGEGADAEIIEELEVTIDGTGATGLLELDAVVLNNEGDEGFSHVAVEIETLEATDVQATIIRANPRYSFDQEVDDYAIKA